MNPNVLKIPFLSLIALLVLSACSTSSPTPAQYDLRLVNDKALPATVSEEVIQDPSYPGGSYRYRVEAVSGWFRLENNRYRQALEFRGFLNDQYNYRFRWVDFGTCQPVAQGLRCQSDYFEGVDFPVTQDGSRLSVAQDFPDEPLRGTYLFERPAK